MDANDVSEMSEDVEYTPSVILDDSNSAQISFQDNPVITIENHSTHLPITILPAPNPNPIPDSSLLDYSMPLQPSYWPSYPPEAYPPHGTPIYNLNDYGSTSPQVEYSLQENYTAHSIPFTVPHDVNDISNTTEDMTFAEAFTTLSKFGPTNTEESSSEHNLSTESYPGEHDYNPILSAEQPQDQSLHTFHQLDGGYYHEYFYPPYSHTSSITSTTVTEGAIEEEIDVTNVGDDFLIPPEQKIAATTPTNERPAKMEVSGPNLQEVSAALFDNSEDYQNIQNCGAKSSGLWRPY